MPPLREHVFICTVCEPMFADKLISVSALADYAQRHVARHSLGRGSSRSRVTLVVSSPVEETDTPELEAILRWETHERAERSKEHLAEEGKGGVDP